jgi:hypothetical protein
LKRLGAILIVALLSLVAAPRTASAQCGPFSKGPACPTSTRPVLRGDFGLQKLAPKPAQPSSKRNWTDTQAIVQAHQDQTPIDCQIIKPVDPQFRSAMPVVSPDRNVRLPMRIIQPPACKR